MQSPEHKEKIVKFCNAYIEHNAYNGCMPFTT